MNKNRVVTIILVVIIIVLGYIVVSNRDTLFNQNTNNVTDNSNNDNNSTDDNTSVPRQTEEWFEEYLKPFLTASGVFVDDIEPFSEEALLVALYFENFSSENNEKYCKPDGDIYTICTYSADYMNELASKYLGKNTYEFEPNEDYVKYENGNYIFTYAPMGFEYTYEFHFDSVDYLDSENEVVVKYTATYLALDEPEEYYELNFYLKYNDGNYSIEKIETDEI